MSTTCTASRRASYLVLRMQDRKSTRLNSSHDQISYAVFCLKKKKKRRYQKATQPPSVLWNPPSSLWPETTQMRNAAPYADTSPTNSTRGRLKYTTLLRVDQSARLVA